MPEQPHLEILSRNRNSTIIVAFIPTVIFSGFILYAIWPFAWIVPYIIGGILTLLTLYSVGLAIIDLRRRWYHAPILSTPEHGHTNAATWEHLPKQLPPPTVIVSEEPGEPMLNTVKQSLDVLELHREGQGYESISKLYKSVGIDYWTPWRVRKLCEEADISPENRTKTREKSTKKRAE